MTLLYISNYFYTYLPTTNIANQISKKLISKNDFVYSIRLGRFNRFDGNFAHPSAWPDSRSCIGMGLAVGRQMSKQMVSKFRAKATAAFCLITAGCLSSQANFLPFSDSPASQGILRSSRAICTVRLLSLSLDLSYLLLFPFWKFLNDLLICYAGCYHRCWLQVFFIWASERLRWVSSSIIWGSFWDSIELNWIIIIIIAFL